jgi:3'-5' exoribonuclease
VPHQFLKELTEGSLVKDYFRLRTVEARTDKSGKPFLNLLLGDRSGAMVARVWSDTLAKCPGPFAAGEAVAVQGQVASFKGELQLTIRYINTVAALKALGKELPDFDPEVLDPATPYDREQLWQELRELAAAHIKPPLGELVLSLLDKNREGFMACPAARVYHHPYLGGLLEHTWCIARNALASLNVYTDLNRDLALAGAILHDVGKIKEIANPAAPELTLQGQLLGHIVLGRDLVREEARTLNFADPNSLLQLEHIILSHHGAVEFGSPVLPKTREALLVYFLDDLDSKLKMMSQHLESDTGEGDFTSYHRRLARALYKGGINAAASDDNTKIS